MLNQAFEPIKMNLQLFAEPAEAEALEDDGSDLFFESESTSEDEKTEAELEEQPEAKQSEEADAEPEKEPEAEKPTSETAKGEKIRLKYNGEEREITLDEAVTLAQKGLNYDKVLQERDALRSTDASFVVKAASEAGMKVPDYLKYVNEQYRAAETNRILEEVQKEHPGLDEAATQEIVRLRLAEKQRETKETEREAEQAEKKKVWVDFVQQYPQYNDLTKFPPKVLEEIQAGVTPIEAMQRHEIAEQKLEIAKLKAEAETKAKNKENKQKSTGSVASSGSEAPDAFLIGFMEG